MVPLSTCTITGTWVTPANVAASGTVVFQPVQEAVGGGYLVAGVPVTATLSGAGSISIAVVNNAAATLLQYQVTELIAGAPSVTYIITPSGSSLDLSTVARGSGTTSPTYIPSSVIQAKGDLLAGTAAGAVAREPVGTDGQVLTAASGQTTGMQWAAATDALAVHHGDLLFNAKDYGAKVDGRRIRNITATAAGTTVTDNSGLANFTNADVGKTCLVYLDGDQDTTTVVGTITTIASVTDSTHVVLTAAAGLTASGTSAYFLYGTNDSTAIGSAFTAATALVATDTTVGTNEPFGQGRPVVLVPATSPQSFCVLGAQITVPTGVAFAAQAMLCNLLADRFAPCIVVNPYGRLDGYLSIEAAWGTGVQLGTAAGTQADIHFGTLVFWHVGKIQEVGGATRFPDAVALLGFGFLGDLIWTKGGARALSMNAGSDLMLNRLFAIGSHCAVSMSQTNQVSIAEITMDSCGLAAGGFNGIELDNACSDIRFNAKAFCITGSSRKLDNVVMVGKTSTNKCIDLKMEISAQATGGNVLNLNNAQDLDADVVASNTASPSSGGANITNALVWGTVAGFCRVTGEMNGSVTPYSGTVAGTFRYARSGIEYMVQAGSAPSIAAQSGNGTSPPTPTCTGNDARGTANFGSGTGPSTGNQVTLTFNISTGYVGTPRVMLTPLNSATAALQLYIASVSTTAFTIGAAVAPTASQSAGTYSVAYQVVG